MWKQLQERGSDAGVTCGQPGVAVQTERQGGPGNGLRGTEWSSNRSRRGTRQRQPFLSIRASGGLDYCLTTEETASEGGIIDR